MEEHNILTRNKLLEILQTVEMGKKVEILHFSVMPATEQGENFISELLKCDITARVNKEEKEYHWMVKIEPVVTEFTKGMHMEEKEIVYYKEMLPKWNKLAAERGAPFITNNFVSPYAEYHGGKEKRSILVMENLLSHGYTEPPNKKKGLSLAHTKVALEELARFHALSYAYLKSYPNGLEEGKADNAVFTTNYLNTTPPTRLCKFFKGYTNVNFVKIIGCVEEPGQDLESIYQKFQAVNDPFELLQMLYKPRHNSFNVVCHGDLWFNNILFK